MSWFLSVQSFSFRYYVYHTEQWESVPRSAVFMAQPAVIAAQLPLSIAVYFDIPLCYHKCMQESGYGEF